MQKIVQRLFFILVLLALLAPWLVIKDLLFPFITSKALFFRLVIELALPLYVYLIVANPKFRPSLKNPLTIALLVFLAVNFISSCTGVNLDRSLWGNFERMGGAFYIAGLVLLYFYVLLLGQMGGKYLWRFLNVLVVLASLMVLDGMLAWPFGKLVAVTFSSHFPWLFDTISDPSFPRISATLGNPIFLGSFLILSGILTAYFALQAQTTLKKICYWAMVLLQLVGIFISGTRGAVVGLAIGIFLAAVAYVALNPSRKVKLYGSLVVGLFVVITGVLFLKHQDLPQGSMLQRVFNLKDSNSEARLIQWKIALKGFPDRPLLGTGPENYYQVGNLYYNPEIYKYDPSWFDKPHNYLLEILVTNGVLGFAAYASVLVFCFWIFWKGYRRELLSLPEFCVLSAGLVIYQVQNLFVFDTIPASLMYYCFLGFAAYLWWELGQEPANNPRPQKYQAPNPAFFYSMLGVGYVVVLYLIYATVWTPAAISRDINYGYAYISAASSPTIKPEEKQANISTGIAYFNSAKTRPFNFAIQETAAKYSEFAVALAGIAEADPALVKDQLQSAIDYENFTANKIKNDPVSWQKLASLYLYQAVVEHSQTIDLALQSAQRAIDLAPKRTEAMSLKAQIYSVAGQKQQALEVLQTASNLRPTELNLKFQIATMTSDLGQQDKAMTIYKDLLTKGFAFTSSSQMSWVLDYYAKHKDYAPMVALYGQAIKLDPNNLDLYFNLAKAYALSGQKDQAINLAQKLLEYYTNNKDLPHEKAVQDFLNSLK